MAREIRHFEDFEIGQRFVSEDYVVERPEILEFARRYDPQSFHTGDRSTENIAPLSDELTASGYHAAAICMRLMVDAFLGETACLTSPGLDYLKWLEPVKAGDALTGRFEVLEKRRSKSNPARGILKVEEVLQNQHGKVVYESVKTLFLGARSPED